MLPANTLFRYRSFYFLGGCILKLTIHFFFWKIVNSFNAKFRNESMNRIMLFFSVIDEL